MNYLDWLVIFIYIIALIVLAWYINRGQRDTQDYYLAGRKIKWWQSGASTMATQLGAISFISAPAFVALKEGGGLKWLAYEFGVPLALILVMAVIIPVLHRHKYISIYEYLEQRYDSATRTMVSIFFQLGRGLATAVTVLAGGLILSTAFSISTINAIILIGAITIIYDVLGGMRVVILSDFVQMLIIVAGILICGGVALNLTGWEMALNTLSPERLQILDFSSFGFTSEGAYAFWPMTIGGFFLYVSYYGCDQSQVQRELSVGSVDDVRKSLLVNAFGRFPIVLLYSLMGILVGALIATPEALIKIAEALQIEPQAAGRILKNDPDRMLPMFIFTYLPHGIIGFIFVAIMAALMSSLDSAINSLSAVTMKDFYQRYFKTSANEKHNLIISKIITALWGIFAVVGAIAFAAFGESTRQTTIVLINAIGSLLYGPILAAFLAGMLIKQIGPRGIKTGVIAGISVNLALWAFTSVSWLWWNLSGFGAAVLTALLTSSIINEKEAPNLTLVKPARQRGRLNWPLIYGFVILWFFIIIFLSFLLQKLI